MLKGTSTTGIDLIAGYIKIFLRKSIGFVLLVAIVIGLYGYIIKHFWEIPQIIEKHAEDKTIIKLLIAIIVCVICLSLGMIC